MMEINYYGLMIALGGLAALSYTAFVWYWQKMPYMWTLLIWVLFVIPFAIFGARLWAYWFDPFTRNFINDPQSIGTQLERFFGLTTKGYYAIEGLAFHGALVFGGLYLFVLFLFHSKRFQISLWLYFDTTVKAIIILQIIGRWGNFFNQELLSKTAFTTNYPQEYSWIPAWFATNLSTFDPATLYHPLFLYESIGLFVILLIFILLPQLQTALFTPWPKVGDFATSMTDFRRHAKFKTRLFPNYFRLFLYKKRLLRSYYSDLEADTSPPVVVWPRFWWPWEKANKVRLKRWFPLRQQIHQAKLAPRVWPWFVLKQGLRRDSQQLTAFFGKARHHCRVGVFVAWYLIATSTLRLLLQPMRRTVDQMAVTIPFLIVLISLGAVLFCFNQWILPNRIRSRAWRYEVLY